MKNLAVCFTAFFCLVTHFAFSQCNNAGFELGNFTGWTGTTGTCCPILLPNNGIVVNRHTITTGPGRDANTCNVVPIVSPLGGSFSARLGNDGVRAQAEGLRYTFIPTPASALFIYQYAVVFQDPGHLIAEQPRFETQVLTPAGQAIPCTQYQVTAASNISGFQTCPGFDINGNPTPTVFRNWSTVGVDLTPYIGQNITVEFKTGDCSRGAHYGYAYIDVIGCQPMEITTNFCVGDSIATLTAPPGFLNYQWSTGDTTQVITVNQNTLSQITCVLTSFSGCTATLVTNVQPADPQVVFSTTNGCLGYAMQTTNNSTSVHSPIIGYVWNFGDNTSSTAASPSHTYAAPGQYIVSLTVNTMMGCTNTLYDTVTVYPLPNVAATSASICPGVTAVLTASGASTYTWSPANWLNTTTGSTVSSTPPVTTSYTVVGTDSNGCTGSAISTVTILPPIAPPRPISHN